MGQILFLRSVSVTVTCLSCVWTMKRVRASSRSAGMRCAERGALGAGASPSLCPSVQACGRRGARLRGEVRMGCVPASGVGRAMLAAGPPAPSIPEAVPEGGAAF